MVIAKVGQTVRVNAGVDRPYAAPGDRARVVSVDSSDNTYKLDFNGFPGQKVKGDGRWWFKWHNVTITQGEEDLLPE